MKEATRGIQVPWDKNYLVFCVKTVPKSYKQATFLAGMEESALGCFTNRLFH